MPSRNSSNAATVVTANRRSTEALVSLTAPVDGEEMTTRVPVRLRRDPGEIGAPRVAVPPLSRADIARFAILVHRLLEVDTTRSRATVALSRRWINDSHGVTAPVMPSLGSPDCAPYSGERKTT
jgi:hypothetical protein